MSGYEAAIIVLAFVYFVISSLPWVARQVGDAVAEFHAARLRGEEILMRRIVLQKSTDLRLSETTDPQLESAERRREFESVPAGEV